MNKNTLKGIAALAIVPIIGGCAKEKYDGQPIGEITSQTTTLDPYTAVVRYDLDNNPLTSEVILVYHETKPVTTYTTENWVDALKTARFQGNLDYDAGRVMASQIANTPSLTKLGLLKPQIISQKDMNNLDYFIHQAHNAQHGASVHIDGLEKRNE